MHRIIYWRLLLQQIMKVRRTSRKQARNLSNNKYASVKCNHQCEQCTRPSMKKCMNSHNKTRFRLLKSRVLICVKWWNYSNEFTSVLDLDLPEYKLQIKNNIPSNWQCFLSKAIHYNSLRKPKCQPIDDPIISTFINFILAIKLLNLNHLRIIIL